MESAQESNEPQQDQGPGFAISDLRFCDAENSGIDLTLTFTDGVTIPYTYKATDNAPAAKAIGEMIASGNYPIAGYVPPTPT